MKGGLWNRIKQVALTDVGVLVKGLDHDKLEDVERTLLEADFGPASFELAKAFEDLLRRGKLKSPEAARAWLEDRLLEYLPPEPESWNTGTGEGPTVVVMLGVNGVGKTTTIAKFAKRLIDRGQSVMLAAADTYRAGASEQLGIWASRLRVPCVMGNAKGDPASVAFDAVESATARGIDVVLIDTAGRLHTHDDLMEELRKIVRVVGRKREGAPHESLLVLDATVGQNALQQGKAFSEAVPVTGLIVTKLDGSAKGGAVVRLRHELGIPIRYVGTGEAIDDLRPFDSSAFIQQLLDN